MLSSKRLEKVENKPALLALVEEKWIDQASICFNSGREVVYFCTNSNIPSRDVYRAKAEPGTVSIGILSLF